MKPIAIKLCAQMIASFIAKGTIDIFNSVMCRFVQFCVCLCSFSCVISNKKL